MNSPQFPRRLERRRGQHSRFLLLVAAIAVGAVSVQPPATATAQDPLGPIVVDGTGSGHGRGLSQWGAYGWAVEHGWSWQQILDHYYGNTVMGDVPFTERITVRLIGLDGRNTVGVVAHGAGGVTAEGPGISKVTAASISAVRNATGSFDVYTSAGTTCAPEELVGTTASISFAVGGGEDPVTDPSMLLGLCQPNGSIVHYRGRIAVPVPPADGVRVVNDVRAEDYLRGVVPREVAASWGDAGARAGMNTLRAQSVAARSYALAQNRYSYAKTCDTTACQSYRGAATRPSATGSATRLEHANTDQAIADTAGKVRRWLSNSPRPAGTIVSTEYSASHGPRTAGYPFPVRDDAGDGTARNPNHRWTRVLDPATLATRYGLGTLLSISMVDGDPRYDGIWYNTVVMTGTARSTPLLVDAWSFRNANGLPSPGFTVTEQSTSVQSPDFGSTLSVSVSASSAGTKPVGALTRVWGRVTGYSGGRVFTEVLRASGWSTSQIVTSSTTGYYQIPLTFGANTPGTYTWRVGAVTPSGVVYSEPFDFVRTALSTTATVSASSVGTKPVGALTRVWGRVSGYSGGRVFTQVLRATGWSTSQIVTSSTTGYYQIPLTFGANTPGTYTWRVGAVTPSGVVYSDTFTLTRV